MHKAPRLTIGLSVFNGVKTIEKTLARLVQIKSDATELIVWDAGSNDGTLEIIKAFEGNIDRFIQRPDNGVYDAWNKIANLANGEFIWFVNADDVPTLDAVEVICRAIHNHNSSVFHFDMFMMDEAGEPLFRKYFNGKSLRNGMNINHPTVVVRTSIYVNEKFNLLYRTSADFDFMCRLSKKYEFHYQSHPTMYMRFGGMSDKPLAALNILAQDLKIISSNFGKKAAGLYLIKYGIIKLVKKSIRFIISTFIPSLEKNYYSKK